MTIAHARGRYAIQEAIEMFTHRLRFVLVFTLLVAGASIAPSAVLGQWSGSAQAGLSEPTNDATRAVSSAPVGPRIPSGAWAPANPLEVLVPGDRVNAGPNVALMGVGLAGLVVGLVIGGDVGMVIAGTGGVIGLVGLYRYLQ